MRTKIFALFCVFGFAAVCIAQDQSPTPAQGLTKHKTHKEAATTSPAETAQSPSAAASPAASPKTKRAQKQAATASTPAASPATSPKGKSARTKGGISAAASPSPSASSAKFNLGDLFKPKNSTAAASPAAAAPVKDASAQVVKKAPAPGGGHGLVWVNTETHVYHKEGSRFYGTTKNGKYMTEAEAVKAGNKAGAERH